MQLPNYALLVAIRLLLQQWLTLVMPLHWHLHKLSKYQRPVASPQSLNLLGTDAWCLLKDVHAWLTACMFIR